MFQTLIGKIACVFKTQVPLRLSFECYFRMQHVLYIPTQISSKLDLVLTDNPNSIDNIEHYPPLGSSDHECLVFDFKCYTASPICKETPCRYNYWKGNYLAICEELDNADWDSLLQHDSIDTNFKNLMLSLVDKFVLKARKKVVTINLHGDQIIFLKLLKINNICIHNLFRFHNHYWTMLHTLPQ